MIRPLATHFTPVALIALYGHTPVPACLYVRVRARALAKTCASGSPVCAHTHTHAACSDK